MLEYQYIKHKKKMKNKKVIAKTIGITKIISMFSTKEKARKFLENNIWKDGVYCMRCKSNEGLTQQKDNFNYWCKSCRKYFNVNTNTILEKTNIPLQNGLLLCI